MSNINGTIGFIDSGAGGMGIALEVLRRLPGERLLYIADNAWCPYGSREPSLLVDRLCRFSGLLLEQGCKIIVIACNTGTVTAIAKIRSQFDIPVVGVVPVIKTASARSISRRIGVLATRTTLASSSYNDLIDQFAPDCKVFGNYHEGLVEAIEFGNWNSRNLRQLLKNSLQPLLDSDIDVLALGCTHFTLIKGRIQDMVGPGIMVLDSNDAVANQVRRVLTANSRLNSHIEPEDSNDSVKLQLYVTGAAKNIRRISSMLFGKAARVQPLSAP